MNRFEVHAKSSGHLACVFAEHHSPKTSIAVQLDSTFKKQQEQYRRMLVAEVSSIMFLIRQGLALRGHTERDSNPTQLLLARSDDVPELKEFVGDGRYLSHDIVNELVEDIALTILRNKLQQVRCPVISYVLPWRSLMKRFSRSRHSTLSNWFSKAWDKRIL